MGPSKLMYLIDPAFELLPTGPSLTRSLAGKCGGLGTGLQPGVPMGSLPGVRGFRSGDWILMGKVAA